ncbi:MAG: hypothetical protein ACI9SC_001925, partial [Gammaproteobacteria bacterium]
MIKTIIVLFLIVLFASVLCAEIGLRFHYQLVSTGDLNDLYAGNPAPGTNITLGDIVRQSPHKDIIYELKPKLDVEFISANLKTNNEGWRETVRSILRKQ